MNAPTPLWSFPDRVAAWLSVPRRQRSQPLPGPLGLPAYARLARTWAPIEPLPPRLHLLVTQLAAVRSGCGFCVQHARHTALKAGLRPEVIDGVAQYTSASHLSDAERAALALADAVAEFAEHEGGFPLEILVRARCHLQEGQIIALVAAAAAEHFFDPESGRLGRDARLAQGLDTPEIKRGSRRARPNLRR
jgi:alkylhydroperoxidase family enzyme